MGGVGSGGGNRISAEDHRRRGTFRPSRHANVGVIVPLNPVVREIPPVPDDLQVAGESLWCLLWRSALWLTELDSEMVYDACRAADDLARARRRYEATTEPSDGRAVEAASRTKSRLLTLLGVGPRDRAALGLQRIEATSKLDALRRRARP
jgi:hypothetical protein